MATDEIVPDSHDLYGARDVSLFGPGEDTHAHARCFTLSLSFVARRNDVFKTKQRVGYILQSSQRMRLCLKVQMRFTN